MRWPRAGRLRDTGRLPLALSLYLACTSAGATSLSLDTVLRSAMEHYPEILAAVQSTRARAGAVEAAEGAFDLQLEQTGYARSTGYYDGRILDSRLVKPVPEFNAELFGGYRISQGEFPIYENELITNQGGEFKVGVVLSLWRDREFDERRFKLSQSRLVQRKAELDLGLTRLQIQHKSATAYLDWIAAGQELAIYRDLLRLATQRQGQLVSKYEEGDVARIALVENRKNLLERRTRLAEAARVLTNKANLLGLFVRDAEGRPEPPAISALPAAFPELPPVSTLQVEQALATTLRRRPETALLDADIQIEQDRLRLGENALLPRVDLTLEASQDIGEGSVTRKQTDTSIMFEVAIPLERRLGEGRRREAVANLQRLDLERRLLEDRIAAEVRNLGTDVEANLAQMLLTAEEVEQALEVEAAERERLTLGASNLFLLNAREVATADARIRHARAGRAYFQSLADYFAATVQTELFFLAE